MQTLFEEFEIIDRSEWRICNFSADSSFCSKAREALEEKYFPLTIVSDEFSRKSVSFQLSKNEAVHSWLKYKEGFSSELVNKLLKEFKCKTGDTVLDPFIGSGTTALAASLNGMDSIGYDILPMSRISIIAKTSVTKYDVDELESMRDTICKSVVPDDYAGKTNELTITKDGYPAENSKEISYITEIITRSDYSGIAKNLFTLCTLNSLEKSSYSAKDGQYLRWDCRCPKIIENEKNRIASGRKPLAVKLYKGEIPSFKESVITELNKVINDIIVIQNNKRKNYYGNCSVIEGSVLFNLPLLPDNSVDAVVSSPPYCNRYDYTRTYALELSYLGKSDKDIKKLRQSLLSCTVENRSKRDSIREFYTEIGRSHDFEKVESIINGCEALTETLEALRFRASNGEINNRGVLEMVHNYFYELTFVFYEIFRVSKAGAGIAFVNDNVRYAGEVVQVDFITCALAESIGFEIKKIYTLRQKKGNSSQQMKKYGRVALRKSITVWQKPLV